MNFSPSLPYTYGGEGRGKDVSIFSLEERNACALMQPGVACPMIVCKPAEVGGVVL
jgi:hypothetical protein